MQGHRIQAYPVLLRGQATVFEAIKRIMKTVSKVGLPVRDICKLKGASTWAFGSHRCSVVHPDPKQFASQDPDP